MQLPAFPPISGETLEAIGKRHDLRAEEIEIMRFFLGSPGRPWTDHYGAP